MRRLFWLLMGIIVIAVTQRSCKMNSEGKARWEEAQEQARRNEQLVAANEKRFEAEIEQWKIDEDARRAFGKSPEFKSLMAVGGSSFYSRYRMQELSAPPKFEPRELSHWCPMARDNRLELWDARSDWDPVRVPQFGGSKLRLTEPDSKFEAWEAFGWFEDNFCQGY